MPWLWNMRSKFLVFLQYLNALPLTGEIQCPAFCIFRICELLIQHKEVFKKHTVGLILRFIRTLKSGMTQATKSTLMSSIHYLLDMCSDYEMRQINAMIDAPSKALFAPVFQSYKKYYQYHGV